jgi:hypothetical protein
MVGHNDSTKAYITTCQWAPATSTLVPKEEMVVEEDAGQVTVIQSSASFGLEDS